MNATLAWILFLAAVVAGLLVGAWIRRTLGGPKALRERARDAAAELVRARVRQWFGAGPKSGGDRGST
jgi:uncharacterized membrane-anchored protein YhcB (DUF1043 family)